MAAKKGDRFQPAPFDVRKIPPGVLVQEGAPLGIVLNLLRRGQGVIKEIPVSGTGSRSILNAAERANGRRPI